MEVEISTFLKKEVIIAGLVLNMLNWSFFTDSISVEILLWHWNVQVWSSGAKS